MLVSEFVEKVKLFNEISGTPEEFNPRKVALYTALCLEELVEGLEAYNCEQLEPLIKMMTMYEKAFKEGLFDKDAENIDRLSALDSAVDVAVVATGFGIAVGSDIVGACHHIADNNLSKFELIDGQYVVLKDENGKVMKPKSYQKPNLEPFLK